MELNDILREAVNYTITNSAIPRSHKSAGRSPSGASVVFINDDGVKETYGKCHRQMYYSDTEVEKDDKHKDPSGQRIFDYGDAIHEVEIEYRKSTGVYVSDELPFWNPKRRVSGRFDVINRDLETNEMYGEEIKTTNPYSITALLTAPKEEHLLQCMLYLDWYSNELKILAKWVLSYFDRAFGTSGSHLITLSNGHVVVNGHKHKHITLDAIYERYDAYDAMLESSTLPDPDYDIVYNQEKLVTLNDMGKFSKTVSDKINKGNKVTAGDWQCRYCDYKNTCLSQREKKDN